MYLLGAKNYVHLKENLLSGVEKYLLAPLQKKRDVFAIKVVR